ncbi:hypothetical protein COO91_04886 [Nostoc flagelliforme CCNUN1]|uniref:Uncharacterized protein n=1 Tax=Nostoc flagelliforme CCNUN1 TaxID=2038116 RepID=A0A2K8STW7_9NOSO|nr:hypothetical protein COO91_04886 [Nostoc flagelliforme CCNUN1]
MLFSANILPSSKSEGRNAIKEKDRINILLPIFGVDPYPYNGNLL